MATDTMKKIVSLAKRRGFIFQSSEIYGGLKACYDYGPLGVELKRNVKAAWWQDIVHKRPDIVGLDCSIIMHPDVWKTSGHLAGFSDPLVDCKNCKERFRADHAPREWSQAPRLNIILAVSQKARSRKVWSGLRVMSVLYAVVVNSLMRGSSTLCSVPVLDR